VFYTPGEKLIETLALILAGGTAMSQLETVIRPDKAIQLAFNQWQCAHSGEIQKMFNRCTPETVTYLQQANGQLYEQHGRALRHPFSQGLLVLDLDLTGLVASQDAEGSTKGYFAKKRGSRGRQLCRIIATPYQEILWQALLSGETLSQAVLKPAIQHAQQRLHLSQSSRQQTLLRWDAGFGTDHNLNWMLTQGYQVLGKVYAHKRVRKLQQSVREWLPTPSSPGREVGVVTQPHRYARRTQQLVVRTPKKSPSTAWGYGALVTTLLELSPQELVDLYDDRGGGIETDFRSDRQGLGLSKRCKHRMAAQQLLIHLAERAHNLLVWTAHQLGSPLNQYGMLRLVRDVFQVNGYLLVVQNQVVEIGLNRYHPLAYALYEGFNRLFAGHPQITLWEPVDYVKEHQRG
jgi:Transposase DDE domain group 1